MDYKYIENSKLRRLMQKARHKRKVLDNPNKELKPVRKDTIGSGLNKQIEIPIINTKKESAGTNLLILRS